MIKAENNNVHLKGSMIDLAYDATNILKELKDLFNENLREKECEELLQEVIRLSKLSDEELEKEASKINTKLEGLGE